MLDRNFLTRNDQALSNTSTRRFMHSPASCRDSFVQRCTKAEVAGQTRAERGSSFLRRMPFRNVDCGWGLTRSKGMHRRNRACEAHSQSCLRSRILLASPFPDVHTPSTISASASADQNGGRNGRRHTACFGVIVTGGARTLLCL